MIKNLLKALIFKLSKSYILVFHHVTTSPTLKRSSNMLSTELFIKIIENFNNFDRLDSVISNNDKKKIAITFDDGLEDVYTIAYKELSKRKIPFTVYIVTDFLDRPGYITTDQLIEMSRNSLVSIGAHGKTHKILTKLDEKEKRVEVELSKKILENIIKKEVTSYAYSHGQFDRETLNLVNEYKNACSVQNLPLNLFTKSKYKLPRINIDNEQYKKVKKIFKYMK